MLTGDTVLLAAITHELMVMNRLKAIELNNSLTAQQMGTEYAWILELTRKNPDDWAKFDGEPLA